MHVVHFLPAFVLALNIEWEKAALPQAVVRFIVDRGRQPQASEHFATPGMLLVLTKRFQDALGRYLF